MIFPRRMLTAALIADPGFQEFAAKEEDDLGFSPADIEESLGLVINGLHGGPGLEVRLAKPHGGEAFVRRMMHGAKPEPAEYAGKRYFRPAMGALRRQSPATCIYLVDDKTFLLANEPELKLMLAAHGRERRSSSGSKRWTPRPIFRPS